MRAGVAELPLTVAICSNRPEMLATGREALLAALAARDRLVVVLDTVGSPAVERLVHALEASGADVIVNGHNAGLAHSRNVAMAAVPTRHLVFIDDDVIIDQLVLDRVRDELANGADVVGVRIVGSFPTRRLPWFVTDGQLHYLAVHSAARPVSVWGACMAFDVEMARRHGFTFDAGLGRRGRGLQSGDDSTFVRRLVAAGGRVATVDDAHVLHQIGGDRLRLGYLLRRAFWQGRSEVRRRDARAGLRKEWRRLADRSVPPQKRLVLAPMFLTAVAAGVLWEIGTAGVLPEAPAPAHPRTTAGGPADRQPAVQPGAQPWT